MKKKVMMGCLFMSMLLLGACQKSNTDTTVESTKQTSNKVESTDSSNSIQKSTTSASSINKTDTNDQVSETQNNLTNEELAIAIYVDTSTVNQKFDKAIDDYTNAYEEDTGYSTKLQLSKNLLPDIIVSRSTMGSTQRFHFDEDLITVTARSNAGDELSQNYGIKELNNKFGKYQEKLALLVSKAEDYSPLEEQSDSTESNSDTNIDTKNLTSEQFKEWVSAVLDKQFTMGRHSFPYKLSFENHDDYAYVRVKHSELQVDTITMFRINSEGQLEEEDRSNGFPVTYKVVSSKFMDTSEVTVNG